MRLLNIDNFNFEEFHGDSAPPYLITSHRWSTAELTYKDVKKKRFQATEGYKKIKGFCKFARDFREWRRRESGAIPGNECNWIWIDTCCIDKSSSAELSEAINSMCSWYMKAEYCLAYLADVYDRRGGQFPTQSSIDDFFRQFRASEWFRRGWTLQELLAPACVVFLDSNWRVLGQKATDFALEDFETLNGLVSEITNIPSGVLQNFTDCRNESIESRMQWTTGRQTTRPEDMAYCMLGIFDVYLPLLYGEGSTHAMDRLMEEVRKKQSRQVPWSAPHTSSHATKRIGTSSRGPRTDDIKRERHFTFKELGTHCTKRDLFVAIHGKVYDASQFADEHPGGEEVLLNVAGYDATVVFEGVGHSDEAREILEGLQVGLVSLEETSKKMSIAKPCRD